MVGLVRMLHEGVPCCSTSNHISPLSLGLLVSPCLPLRTRSRSSSTPVACWTSFKDAISWRWSWSTSRGSLAAWWKRRGHHPSTSRRSFGCHLPCAGTHRLSRAQCRASVRPRGHFPCLARCGAGDGFRPWGASDRGGFPVRLCATVPCGAVRAGAPSRDREPRPCGSTRSLAFRRISSPIPASYTPTALSCPIPTSQLPVPSSPVCCGRDSVTGSSITPVE